MRLGANNMHTHTHTLHRSLKMALEGKSDLHIDGALVFIVFVGSQTRRDARFEHSIAWQRHSCGTSLAWVQDFNLLKSWTLCSVLILLMDCSIETKRKRMSFFLLLLGEVAYTLDYCLLCSLDKQFLFF